MCSLYKEIQVVSVLRVPWHHLRHQGWAPSQVLTCLAFPFTGAADSDDSAAAGLHAGSQR